MESHQTVAEGREDGMNSKSFRTSVRRNAGRYSGRAFVGVIKFVPPQVPKLELMNTIHPSFSANYNLIRRSVEGLFRRAQPRWHCSNFIKRRDGFFAQGPLLIVSVKRFVLSVPLPFVHPPPSCSVFNNAPVKRAFSPGIASEGMIR
ncbi:hypothetical protein CDAR_485361 [Caerostris darwini]|uniref:Uncharacterized protein n=1 Tax=Caerostris darwini TaxID=1538125 RepID=A0AAV4PA20_9ARAC|nr:hypothetical protein CDAR_485361 [Caerostris darwini]